ncbi:thiamine-phosphate kinase [Frankia sp. R82]|uniref:thiamine-phosphate kinase n=1 Tax=Frankia sp. R82 TaxID=2950553 RepID=UPI002042F464|nr:thiamine-phosphate kinase [Frankia sp. R82]MCM3885851.1 thiamine-phosphate kinase [Frankia sp. R82]
MDAAPLGPGSPYLRDLGEFELIQAITARFAPTRDVLVGPGDDAAVLSAPDGRVVVTTDLLVEGRHFRRDWSSGEDVGHKAAAQNLADVAAMGARPTSLFLGLAAPGSTELGWVLSLADGLAAEGARAGTTVAGGDISSADTIMLGVTALGDLAGRAPVLRSGARPGDILVLAGTVGPAAAGLALLTAGLGATQPEPDQPEPDRLRSSGAGAGMLAAHGWDRLLAAHRRPRPPYPLGPALAALGARAMCDVSDGLLQDVGHLAAASGVRIDLTADALPMDDALRSAAAHLDVDPLGWVLTGGEDHALVACLPPLPRTVPLPTGCRRIGSVRAGRGVTVDGQTPSGAGGWTHFGRPHSSE